MDTVGVGGQSEGSTYITDGCYGASIIILSMIQPREPMDMSIFEWQQ